MSEYVKDTSRPQGWKMVSYKKHGRKDDGAPITADQMDESMDDASEAEPEPEPEAMEWSVERRRSD